MRAGSSERSLLDSDDGVGDVPAQEGCVASPGACSVGGRECDAEAG